MTVWLNDDWTEGPASIDARDRGLLIGDGVFETVYVNQGRAAFLGPHLARLRRGLALLDIDEPPGLAEAGEIVTALYARDAHQGPAAARLTVTRGPGARGLDMGAADAPTFLVALSALGPPRTAPRLLFLSPRRRHAGASTGAFKPTGGYLENMLAHRDAKAAGADEALMLNEHGRLACAAAANVFLIDGETVATPPPEEGAMPGIVRAAVIEEAARAGLAVEERPVAPEELEHAEIFLTNSLIGVAPADLLGAPPRLEAGKVFRALQSCYQKRLLADLSGK